MTLTPCRVMLATAPSGGQLRFVKYLDQADRELSFYRGHLSAAEDTAFWRAKLRAERPGLDKWHEAAAILTSAGWRVTDENTE